MRADRSLRRPVSPFLLLLLPVFLANPAPAEETPVALNALLQKAHEQNLSAHPTWRLLLHYRRDLLRRYRSEVDDLSFFLSPRGNRDPSAELDATLKAFFEPPSISTETSHPQCRYPARFAWLKEQLQWADLPAGQAGAPTEQPCPRFEKWRQQMDADSLTMIFASYYVNNPASMYGHTFFRLNSKRHAEKDRLLDYAVNFAAYPENNNPILYILEGLTGGHPGKFSSLPYYMKVQEYNNLESRDLWEYSLKLEPGSVDRLVQHLWEMGQASMAYYFLNKNCSYQLLPVLEVAQPSLKLADPYWFKAIPADTLRSVIEQPGLLTGVHLRPSHASKMLAAREHLSREEIRTVERLARRAQEADLRELESYSKERQAKILDSAYDLFRYRVGFARDQPQAVLEHEQSLLLARNKLGEASPTAFGGPPSPDGRGVGGEAAVAPDKGHPTGRVGLSFGASRRSTFEELSLRAALHDHEDDPVGYVRGSQLEMLHLRLRYDNEERVPYIQELTLIDIMSLSPWDRWIRKPSWKVHTGLSVATDVGHDPENSLYYGLHTGPGFSLQTRFLRREQWCALALVDTGLGQVFEEDYRLGGGTESGILVEAAPWWHLHFSASYLRYPLGDVGSAVKLRLVQAFPLSKKMQGRVTLERRNRYKEVVFSLLRYF